MALSRIKNWVAEILTHADLNAEFNNILNNALSLVSPLTGNLDVNSKTLSNVGTISGTPTFSSTTTFTGAATFSAAINEAHGADIASAATVNLTTATGNVVDITGTTTITAITLTEGYERTTRFTGALTLTNGASLVLLGGNNITTVAGDYAIWRGYAAGVVRMVSYGRGTGESLNLIRSQTASASATIDFTSGLSSSYDEYLLTITNLLPATNASDVWIRVSQSAVFISGATDYAYTSFGYSSTPSTANSSSAGANAMAIAITLSNTSNFGLCGAVRFFAPTNTTQNKRFMWQTTYQSATDVGTVGAASFKLNTGAIDGIRIIMSSGNITSGTFALYGVRKT